MGGIWEGHAEGLLVDLEEGLGNCLETQEMKAWYLGLGGKLLTQTDDIVKRGKERFKDLLNPPFMYTFEEAESENLGEDTSINMVEVFKVVKIFLVPGSQG